MLGPSFRSRKHGKDNQNGCSIHTRTSTRYKSGIPGVVQSFRPEQRTLANKVIVYLHVSNPSFENIECLRGPIAEKDTPA